MACAYPSVLFALKKHPLLISSEAWFKGFRQELNRIDDGLNVPLVKLVDRTRFVEGDDFAWPATPALYSHTDNRRASRAYCLLRLFMGEVRRFPLVQGNSTLFA